MEFLNIGPLELIIILVLMFVLLGPREMILTAHRIGSWVRNFLRSPMWREIWGISQDIREFPKKIMSETGLDETLAEVKQSTKEATDEINKELKEAADAARVPEAEHMRIDPNAVVSGPPTKPAVSVPASVPPPVIPPVEIYDDEPSAAEIDVADPAPVDPELAEAAAALSTGPEASPLADQPAVLDVAATADAVAADVEPVVEKKPRGRKTQPAADSVSAEEAAAVHEEPAVQEEPAKPRRPRARKTAVETAVEPLAVETYGDGAVQSYPAESIAPVEQVEPVEPVEKPAPKTRARTRKPAAVQEEPAAQEPMVQDEPAISQPEAQLPAQMPVDQPPAAVETPLPEAEPVAEAPAKVRRPRARKTAPVAVQEEPAVQEESAQTPGAVIYSTEEVSVAAPSNGSGAAETTVPARKPRRPRAPRAEQPRQLEQPENGNHSEESQPTETLQNSVEHPDRDAA